MAGKQRDIDPKMLEILVAPGSHAPLRYDAERQELISDQDGLAFPVRDGIPILLIDEARRLDDTPVPPKPVGGKAGGGKTGGE